MSAVTDSGASKAQAAIASAEVRRLVERLVRRRVPAADVEDVVQTVLCDALASDRAPDELEALRRWIVGITRHKVADFHRRGARGRSVELPAQLAGEPPPHSAREWARWAEQQAGDDAAAKRTLGWMAREGAGEKLAHIAQSERLPAAQVRQRVSRMRRFMKRQWVAELAAVAGLGLLALAAWYLLREPAPTAGPKPGPVPELSPLPVAPEPRLRRAHQLRADALRECERRAWERCLMGLDEAARLDPEGADDELLGAARRQAVEALAAERRNQDQQPAPQPTSVVPKHRRSPSPKTGPDPKLERELMKQNKRRRQAPHKPLSNSELPAPPPEPQKVKSNAQQQWGPSQLPPPGPSSAPSPQQVPSQPPWTKGGKGGKRF